MEIKVFACPTAEDFTKEICQHLDVSLGKMNVMKFKNDNTFVQILETVRDKDVYIVQTTQPPVNESRINVVLPYYMYSRSDKKDQPRVPVTAKLFAQMLEVAGTTRVITCDLHNPAIEAYFNINCDKLSAKKLLQEYFLEKKLENMVVLATDAGSSKKAHKYSEFFGCPLALIDKRRDGNNDKAIASNVIGDVEGKEAIIFDDEIDTAGSIIETARILEEHKAKSIYAGCTHGILSADAVNRIYQSPIKELVITNTVPLTEQKRIDKITVLSIAPLFAQAIRRIHEGRPLGEIL